MAKYTIELSLILRGLSEANEKYDLYVSPRSMIEMSYKNFFKAIGDYSFKIWGDERDLAFKEQFEKNFLERFYMKEIGYYTADAFILELGSFLRRKVPVYCQHWRNVLDQMYVTNTGNVTGNSVGSSKSDDTRTTDSNGKSNSKSIELGAANATPQSYLDIDLNKLNYASQVRKSEVTTESENEDHTVSVGGLIGSSENKNITENYGRNKDVFDIFDQWVKSGYDLYSPLYDEVIKEKLFLVFAR